MQGSTPACYPALPLSAVRTLSYEHGIFDDALNDDADFAAFMGRAGVYYSERCETKWWKTWTCVMLAAGGIIHLLITVFSPR